MQRQKQTEGLHPAIICQDDFDAVQQKRQQHSTVPVSISAKLQNPLSGILFCAKCGKAMVRRPYGDKNKADTLYCKTIGCPNVGAKLQLVEERILHGVAEWLEQYRMQWQSGQPESQIVQQINTKAAAAREFQKELQTLKQQQEKTYDLLEQGIYSTEVFLERSHSIAERMQYAEEQIAFCEKEMEYEKRRRENIIGIIPRAEYLLEVYGTLQDAEEKNRLLKSVVQRVEYEKDHSTRWHGSPDDFKITLFPQIPK